MNKPECRKFSGQQLRIRPSDGLLRAEAIEWLVTSAVKIIGHSRVLVLNLYSREQAVNGGLAPKFTVFHTKNDYITLEHKDDGNTAWRTGAFDRVTGYWQYSKYCAFVSLADEQRVTRYFGDAKWTGFNALKQAQYAIQDQRRAKREKQRQQKIRERMRNIPAVPSGLEEWARRQVMPAYFLYVYQKGRKATAGVCSACGQEITLPGVKHNAKAVCPHCGRELTMKSRGRVKNLYDRDTCQVIQKAGPNELVIRIFKVYANPMMGSMSVWETARQFIRQEAGGSLSYEDYYIKDDKWKKGKRPLFILCQYQFEADDCAHLYCGNLPGALKGTPWQYTPIKAFYEYFREHMQARPFLAADLAHPRLEHLVKTGFYNLASDLAYRNNTPHKLDETQDRTHRILGVAAEDVIFLRDMDADMATLQKFIQYRGLKDRQILLRWQLAHNVQRDIPEILRQITPHKLMKYLEQQRFRPEAGEHYRNMQAAVTEYRDYLEMCGKLGDDLSNSFVLFPKNLHEAHDNASRRQKIKVSKELRRNFRIAYKQVMSHLDFELEGLKIVCPADPEEIVHEGQALHHCVGGYVDRVGKKECLILFLRHSDDLSTPFYTVEVRNRKAVQVRGYGNADPTPEVKNFMAAWERQVLQAAA